MRRCGPGRGSRQAVQVGGTFVVEGGIDEIQESFGVIFSFGGPRMVDPDGR